MPELAEFLVKVINGVGMSAFLGLLGCYLIVVAIVGRFIPRNISVGSSVQRTLLGLFGLVLAVPVIRIGYYDPATAKILPPLTREVVDRPSASNGGLRNEFFRHTEGAKDHRAGVLWGFTGEWRHEPATLYISAAYDPTSAMTTLAQLERIECHLVESFGLDATNIRRLKDARFQNEVYVYVGDIHDPGWKPFDVYFFIGDNSWPNAGKIDTSEFRRRINNVSDGNKQVLRVRGRGDSIAFRYHGRTYRLTVTEIYAVLLGTDKIAVEICERP